MNDKTSDEANEVTVSDQDDTQTDAPIDTLGSDLTEMFDGLPDPVQQGILKTAKRLGTALLDLGAAKIEGKTAEIQAVTASRTAITKATAEKIRNHKWVSFYRSYNRSPSSAGYCCSV